MSSSTIPPMEPTRPARAGTGAVAAGVALAPAVALIGEPAASASAGPAGRAAAAVEAGVGRLGVLVPPQKLQALHLQNLRACGCWLAAFAVLQKAPHVW
ncbi:hypothetical protein AB1Y20_020691 [Prymnesium parvum]|uniref:Uncharacterized protein n=1 Tax=Prymnesium parvum TaxID=97485 RepID=A0AB34JVZ5_PRYPA